MFITLFIILLQCNDPFLLILRGEDPGQGVLFYNKIIKNNKIFIILFLIDSDYYYEIKKKLIIIT